MAKERQPTQARRRPVRLAQQVESELWAARLGSCGEKQLEMLAGNADGIPDKFYCHPFRYIPHKEQARIQKHAAQRKATRMDETGARFFMDYGFMRASTAEYGPRSTEEDRVITSFDGFEAYLIAIDECSRHGWVFLFATKEPPVDTVRAFLKTHGQKEGGLIQCDQGGELARSNKFRTAMHRD